MAKEKSDIEINPKNKGKFTSWVKRNMPGKSVCTAASTVMKNKDKYDAKIIKQANFAKNFACKK